MSDEAIIRRERLRSLKMTPSEIAARMPPLPSGKKRNASYFSDLMNKDGKSFGEKAARSIEDDLGLPRFWLDGRDRDGLDASEVRQALVTPSGDVQSRNAQAHEDSVIKKLLSGVAAQLVRIPRGPDRRRVAELLSAWALAPDSPELLESISAELSGSDAPSDNPPVEATEGARRTAVRINAMRMAENHRDPRFRAMAAELLRMAEEQMLAALTENARETRHHE